MVKALNENILEDLGITILRRVQRLIRLEGLWRVHYVTRSDNSVVDRMAKLGLSLKTSLQTFDSPLNEVLRVFQQILDV